MLLLRGNFFCRRKLSRTHAVFTRTIGFAIPVWKQSSVGEAWPRPFIRIAVGQHGRPSVATGAPLLRRSGNPSRGRKSGFESLPIPKGLCPKAQGCLPAAAILSAAQAGEERATLGRRGKRKQPRRGCGHTVEPEGKREFSPALICLAVLGRDA